MTTVGFGDLLVEAFGRKAHAAVLLQGNRFILVLDQVAIRFRLHPTAALNRISRGRIFAKTKRLRVERIKHRDFIVNSYFIFVVAKLMVQTSQFVHHFHVAGVFFE